MIVYWNLKTSKEGIKLQIVYPISFRFYEANILVQASDELYDFYEPFVTDNRAKRALAYLKANNSYAYDIEPFNVVNKEPKKVKTSQREMSIFFLRKRFRYKKQLYWEKIANDASFYGYLAHIYYPNVRLSYKKPVVVEAQLVMY